MNFINFLPDTFHVYLAFKSEENWQNTADKALFDYTYEKIRNLNGNINRVEEIQIQDIDKWIQKERNRTFPEKDLARIKEYSGGIPLILESWITTSKKLKYEEINRNDHCQQILNLAKGLSDEDQIRLSKLSVTVYPIQDEFIAKNYLGWNSVDYFNPFNRRMIERGIFEQNSEKVSWFRHELVKYCFENDLSISLKQKYHGILVNYFKKLIDNNKQSTIDNDLSYGNNYQIKIAYSYHLHNSGSYTDSFIQNKELANYAIKLGDLDLAERSFQRVLYAASQVDNISRSELIECLESFTMDILKVGGRYDEALIKYLDIKNYYYDTNDQNGIANAFHNIGVLYGNKREYPKAMTNLEESLKIYRKLDAQQGIAKALHSIGNTLIMQGEYPKAMTNYEESLDIHRKFNDQEGIAKSLNNIGNTLNKKGEFAKAMTNYEESLDIVRKLGNQQFIDALVDKIRKIKER